MMCSCPEEKLAVEIWERKRAGHGQHRTNSIPSRHIQSIQVPQSASEHKEKRSFDLRSAGGKGVCDTMDEQAEKVETNPQGFP